MLPASLTYFYFAAVNRIHSTIWYSIMLEEHLLERCSITTWQPALAYHYIAAYILKYPFWETFLLSAKRYILCRINCITANNKINEDYTQLQWLVPHTYLPITNLFWWQDKQKVVYFIHSATFNSHFCLHFFHSSMQHLYQARPKNREYNRDWIIQLKYETNP